MAKVATHPSFIAPAAATRPSRAVVERVRRIRQMSLAEIAERSRQEATKLLDRVTAERSIDPHAILQEHAPALARPEVARRILRDAAPRRFFSGVEQPAVVACVLPEHRATAIERSESALRNR